MAAQQTRSFTTATIYAARPATRTGGTLFMAHDLAERLESISATYEYKNVRGANGELPVET